MLENKIGPFDIVNLIYSKDRELTPEEIETFYNAFLINKALSNNLDTVFFANEMNHHWQLSKKMQFDFLFYGVDKRKRYGRWFKKDQNGDELEKIDLIKRCFDYSESKAREVLPIMEHLNRWDEIREELRIGGLSR